jgi:para-nitrobenzyl esterase
MSGKKSWRLPLALLGVVLVAVIALASAARGDGAAASARPATGSPVVATADGLVRGTASGTTRQFLGIPYAAPPVGSLRWQPPAPPTPWKGVRAVTAFAPHCPQPGSDFGVASTSEDCLYLNVYAPAGSAGKRLPVMVWLHGGSLLVGESDDYDPAALVGKGVIVVTINYRIGALGFLADSALASGPGGASGNYGLMDQQAALRWVQRNIGAFGGDSRRVTLFGESAGGLSVLAQLTSPGARGLFSAAIVESGTYALTEQTESAAEASGAAFAAKAGCAANTASCLRALPVQTIIGSENLNYEPNIDGLVLSQSIGAALRAGDFSRVPVVIGTNHDEWRLFVGLDTLLGSSVTAANYQSTIASTLGVTGPQATAIAARYPLSAYPSPAIALGAVGTDAVFACPALSAEESLARYVPTYAYEFNDENAPERYLPPAGFSYGAAHESEVQYLFTLRNTPQPGVLSGGQQALAAAMQRDWTQFAKTGRPGGWPRFSGAAPLTQSLVPPEPRAESGYAAEHQCGFWATVATSS